MTLNIELSPEREQALQEAAIREGVPAAVLAAQLLDDSLQDMVQDAADLIEAEQRMQTTDPSQRRSLAELRTAIYGKNGKDV